MLCLKSTNEIRPDQINGAELNSDTKSNQILGYDSQKNVTATEIQTKTQRRLFYNLKKNKNETLNQMLAQKDKTLT